MPYHDSKTGTACASLWFVFSLINMQWIPLLPYLVNCILFYRSEANDLALSIAKAATESSHVLALDG